MKNYEVSVCIVTFNNAGKVEKTIASILEYTKGLNHNIYIVDNLSTDNTVKSIRELFPDLTIIQAEKNNGFGAGHNLALPFLNSKYHAIINPDIVINNDVLTNMAEYLDENDNIGMLSPKILYEDGSEQILGKRNPSPKYLIANRLRHNIMEPIVKDYAMLNEDLTKPFEIQNASGCFMFVRTQIFKEIKGFDENFFLYFEDADLTRRVNKIKKTLYYPYATVYHEWERGGAKSFKMFLIQLKSSFKYFLKWGFGNK